MHMVMVFAMGDVAPIEGEAPLLDQNLGKSLEALVSYDDSSVIVPSYAIV